MIQIFKHVQLIYTLYQLVFIFIVMTLWLLSNISYTITLVSFSDKTVALWIIEIHFANWKENYMISQVKLGEQDHHFGSYIEIYFSLPVFVDIQMQKLPLWDLCWHICTWGWGNATKCSWKYKFQNTWAFLFSTPILLSFKF